MSTENIARYEVKEDFPGGHKMEVWGVGTEAVTYATDEVGGVAILTTGGTDDNNCVIAAQGFKPSLGPVYIEVRLKVPSLADVAFNVGFSDVLDGTTPVLPFEFATTSLTTAPASGAAFLYDTDATTDVLRVGAVKANVDTKNAAAGEPNALTADTMLTLRVEIDPTGDVRWIADGKQVASQASAVTPTSLHKAYVMVETRTGSAKSVEVDYFHAVQNGRQ